MKQKPSAVSFVAISESRLAAPIEVAERIYTAHAGASKSISPAFVDVSESSVAAFSDAYEPVEEAAGGSAVNMRDDAAAGTA